MKNKTAARIAVAASVSKRNSVITRPQQFIITFYDRATQAYNVIRVSNRHIFTEEPNNGYARHWSWLPRTEKRS